MMPRALLPSPRSARLPLSYSRPLSAPSLSGLSSPLSERVKIYTGKDLKHQLPAFERVRTSAAVARARRFDEEAHLFPHVRDLDLGKLYRGRASLYPLSSPPSSPYPAALVRRGILKNSVDPAPKATDRHVHFGDVTVNVVDRWMRPDPDSARRWAENRDEMEAELRAASSSAAPLPVPAMPGSLPLERDKYFDEYASRPSFGRVIGQIFLGSTIVVVGLLALIRYDFF